MGTRDDFLTFDLDDERDMARVRDLWADDLGSIYPWDETMKELKEEDWVLDVLDGFPYRLDTSDDRYAIQYYYDRQKLVQLPEAARVEYPDEDAFCAPHRITMPWDLYSRVLSEIWSNYPESGIRDRPTFRRVIELRLEE